jgi:hypothetical protein
MPPRGVAVDEEGRNRLPDEPFLPSGQGMPPHMRSLWQNCHNAWQVFVSAVRLSPGWACDSVRELSPPGMRWDPGAGAGRRSLSPRISVACLQESPEIIRGSPAPQSSRVPRRATHSALGHASCQLCCCKISANSRPCGGTNAPLPLFLGWLGASSGREVSLCSAAQPRGVGRE